MIKWFKVYFISSTYTQDIINQSCITNRETPCRLRELAPGPEAGSRNLGQAFLAISVAHLYIFHKVAE